jgi:hypothetical protein
LVLVVVMHKVVRIHGVGFARASNVTGV